MHVKPHDCREELKSAGSRVTPGRLAILKILEKSRAPRTVAELADTLPALNEATLYRALEALAAAGLLRRGIRNGVMQYEYAGKPHHHHLVCTDCGFAPVCRNC